MAQGSGPNRGQVSGTNRGRARRQAARSQAASAVQQEPAASSLHPQAASGSAAAGPSGAHPDGPEAGGADANVGNTFNQPGPSAQVTLDTHSASLNDYDSEFLILSVQGQLFANSNESAEYKCCLMVMNSLTLGVHGNVQYLS